MARGIATQFDMAGYRRDYLFDVDIRCSMPLFAQKCPLRRTCFVLESALGFRKQETKRVILRSGFMGTVRGRCWAPLSAQPKG